VTEGVDTDSGRSIADALTELLRNEQIAVFRYIPYRPRPGLAERARNASSPRWSTEALRHDPGEMLRARPATEDMFTTEWLAQNTPAGEVIGLCSQCELKDGTRRHIPMLDLQCDPSGEVLPSVVASMKALGLQAGLVAESGRSYHVYGLPLLDEVEWLRFMHYALLLYPLIDPRWMGHRLLDRCSVLRINSGGSKARIPTVVASWGSTV